jgi:hypothetical protein
MPLSLGPKVFGQDNLVFAYDTGDIKNSFRGKPVTNILKSISQQYGESNTSLFKVKNGTHTVNIPGLGQYTAKYVDIYNDYNGGSGNCCLSLFSYGTGINLSGGVTYMYQIIYKTDTGYSHPNYMYRYEYGASGYITEAGVHSTGRRTALGDGWYHAWGSFTTNANTTYINTYLFHYEYGTQNRVQVAAAMLTEGSEVIPPKQFLGFEQTRSVTEGLVDMMGNGTINLTNASYNANANISFDGTNDYISLGSSLSSINTTTLSIEFVFKCTDSDGSYNPIFSWHTAQNNNGYISLGNFTGTWPNESISIYMRNSNTDYLSFAYTNGHSFYQDSQYHHAVFILKTNSYKIYVDGVEKTLNGTFRNGSMSTTMLTNMFNLETSPTAEIGVGSSFSEYFKGEIPILKIYNAELGANQIASNYNSLKKRFNM